MTSADRLAAMETGLKDRLHLLVDALPAGELPAAERYLEFLSGHTHPFVRALMDAPGDPEPLSDADREALEEGRRALVKRAIRSPTANCAPNSGYDMDAGLDPSGAEGYEEARPRIGRADSRRRDPAG